MKVIISPDSFKGSISAGDLCDSIEQGIINVFPNAEISKIPLADGGEGTMENMVYSSNGKIETVTVKGPMGEQVSASYGTLGDGRTAVIEMAQASGLPLVDECKRNPLIATSFGTGELIIDALNKGYRKFIIGLGGSATNDAGTGMLKALGMKFYDQDGNELKDGGGDLAHLSFFDETGLDARIKDSTFIIASDVSNQLCGVGGASFVFGPQKGATKEMVNYLDQALSHFNEIVIKQKGIDMNQQVGGGAAGGMGSAVMTFLNGSLNSGIDVIMDAIDFKTKIKNADLIITGEGKLDEQTLSGKVIAGVCKEAKNNDIPVIALCGGTELSSKQMDQLGIIAGFSIVPMPCSLKEAMYNAREWAVKSTEQIMRVIKMNF